MAGAPNNSNKAPDDSLQDTSRLRRWSHQNFEDDTLISLLMRGQSSSIQRNSRTTVHSGTHIPRTGLVEAMEAVDDLISRYPSGTAATRTIPQLRARQHSSGPPTSEETRRRNLSAVLFDACQLVEAYLLSDSDDESGDL
jgi:hypothetical protein